MLKSDLIAILVQKRDITQRQAELTVETIFECMKEALCKGDNIEIRGLGAFHVKDYAGYQGRNPKTGQVIPVRPKRGILFRTGKELRDRVNRAAAQQLVDLSASGASADGASRVSQDADDDDLDEEQAGEPSYGVEAVPGSLESSGSSSGLAAAQGEAGFGELEASEPISEGNEVPPPAGEPSFAATAQPDEGEGRRADEADDDEAGGNRGPTGSAQLA